MLVIIVNRKLSTVHVYGPFVKHSQAHIVADLLRKRAWVKTAEVMTMGQIREENNTLVESAEI